jgi:hypothetical protein
MQKQQCDNCGQYKVQMRPAKVWLGLIGAVIALVGWIMTVETSWGWLEIIAGIGLIVWGVKLKGQWCANCRKLFV